MTQGIDEKQSAQRRKEMVAQHQNVPVMVVLLKQKIIKGNNPSHFNGVY
ncbi:MAG: hypothetical protein M3Y65_18335 [Pseudomonadota bacterium]|nr:hypothetical protein [Pseudomonadota bacterium]